MSKTYSVSDLFFTQWEELHPATHAKVYALHTALPPVDDLKYGFCLINILRLLRRRKSLVNKITVEQAVDIFNDLNFLREPWYFFPDIDGRVTPDPKMARCSFDQFIYSDNEFSNYLLHQDEKYIRRLVATLYLLPDESHFDPETVERRESEICIEPYLLHLVFFTFAQIRTMVMKRCSTLLPVSKPDPESKPSNTGPMWYKIKHQAARTHVFGTFQETGRGNMYSVLDHLELLAKENEEHQRRLKNAKSQAHRSR